MRQRPQRCSPPDHRVCTCRAQTARAGAELPAAGHDAFDQIEAIEPTPQTSSGAESSTASRRPPLPPVDLEHLASRGVDQSGVAAPVRAGVTNPLARGSSRSPWHVHRANLFTPFNAAVGAGTVVLIFSGDWHDGLFGFTA